MAGLLSTPAGTNRQRRTCGESGINCCSCKSSPVVTAA
jgi:hypothetical protein